MHIFFIYIPDLLGDERDINKKKTVHFFESDFSCQKNSEAAPLYFLITVTVRIKKRK